VVEIRTDVGLYARFVDGDSERREDGVGQRFDVQWFVLDTIGMWLKGDSGAAR
jgi:hypothetical protein